MSKRETLNVRDALRMGLCSHCGVQIRNGQYTHEDTCPLFAALERTAAEDAAWFEAHPGQRKRRRPTTPAERDEMRIYQCPADQLAILTRVGTGTYERMLEPSGRRDMIVVSA
ncbi:hypothetical protein AB0H79_05840 [Micrococcus luteus]|uniref:hypothetical protein n=1 Tax=Micrococcus luteus TaxID=1270 RepID=UPI0033F40D8C